MRNIRQDFYNLTTYLNLSMFDEFEYYLSKLLTFTTGRHDLNDIYKLKEQIILSEEVPTFIKILLNYVRKMKFDETPDYNYIINIIIETFKTNLFENNDKFEWN